MIDKAVMVQTLLLNLGNIQALLDWKASLKHQRRVMTPR
jgi:hypothetical protein